MRWRSGLVVTESESGRLSSAVPGLIESVTRLLMEWWEAERSEHHRMTQLYVGKGKQDLGTILVHRYMFWQAD